MQKTITQKAYILFLGGLFTCASDEPSLEENPDLATRFYSTQLCGESPIANGYVEIRYPGSGRLAGTDLTDDNGDYCADATLAGRDKAEVCIYGGVYRTRNGETYPPVDDAQMHCKEWFGGEGAPPTDALNISWRSHARYKRYRYLVAIGMPARDAHDQASAEFEAWVGRRAGRSVADAVPMDISQDFDEPPTMTASLVAGWLDEAWDTVWPDRINKRLYRGEPVVTPPLLSAILLDGDLGHDGSWDSIGSGGTRIALPDTDHELDAHFVRGGVTGLVEALVTTLRDDERNRTGYTDRLPLVQEMSRASGGYFPSDGGRVYDLGGPTIPSSNMTKTTVVQQQFELVAQLADMVPIRSAGLVVPADACYSVTSDSDALRCEDDRRACTLTTAIDASQCGYVEEALELESTDGHGNTSLHRFAVLINPDPPRLIVDSAPKDETVPAFGSSFNVSGHCVNDDHITIESTSVEIIDADGVAITAAVGANKCAQVPGCFDFPVDVAELATDKYTVRVSCIDVRGVAADDYSHPVEIDVNNPVGEIDLVIPEDRPTREHASGATEVGGDIEEGSYVPVAGTFSDRGTGVKDVWVTVDGKRVDVPYDMETGTFADSVKIACNQRENVVIGVQVEDNVGRTSELKTKEVRCDAYPAKGVFDVTGYWRADTLTVTEDGGHLFFGNTNATWVTVKPDSWPLRVIKFVTRQDLLPEEQDLGIVKQNLMQIAFAVSDSAESGLTGVYARPDQITVDYRFSIGGVEVRGWTDLERTNGKYVLPFAYQTLHRDIGTVDRDTPLLVEVRVSDGIYNHIHERKFYNELMHPPVFQRNCVIVVVYEDPDGVVLWQAYTRDDNVPFAECELVRVLDLPPDSLAPKETVLAVEILAGEEIATLQLDNAFAEKVYDGNYESFRASGTCPYQGVFAHKLGARDEYDESLCFGGKYEPNSSRVNLNAENPVFGRLQHDGRDLPQDLDGYWSLPEGTHSLVMVSPRPRAKVHLLISSYPLELWLTGEYNWNQYWSRELEESGYVLDGNVGYDLRRTDEGIDARDWTSPVFVESVELSVQIPEMRVTHPIYGEIEVIKDSDATSVTTTLSEGDYDE